MKTSVIPELMIVKLKAELENLRKAQSTTNECNKNQSKVMTAEIETLKTDIVKYQTILGPRSSKIELLEKEMVILKDPQVAYASNDSADPKFIKRPSISEGGLINVPDISNNNHNKCFDEKVNFLVMVRL